MAVPGILSEFLVTPTELECPKIVLAGYRCRARRSGRLIGRSR